MSISAPALGLALNLMSRRDVPANLRVHNVSGARTWQRQTRALVVLEGRVVLGEGAVLGPHDVAVMDGELAADHGAHAVVAEVGIAGL